MKVLVARTDKLGDVVLSLPVFAYLKERRPAWSIQALVAPGAVPLVENDPHLDAVWTYDATDRERLVRGLAAEGFAAAIVLHYRREVAADLRRAGIPRRYGPWSKVTSWFLLNRGVWQRRSRAGRHEMDYNLDLAARLTGRGGARGEPRLHLTAGQLEIGRAFRRDEAAGAELVAFVHPGSGGSALNWPAERFAAVAAALARRPGWRVFLTGGPDDAEVVARVGALAGPPVESLAGRHDLRDFLGLLSGGDLLVGPSTGPLHIAAALGLGAVGLYPPVPVQSPRRWGPRGLRARALVPEVSCPARLSCFGERCRHWNCMERIAVDAVVAEAAAILAAGVVGGGPTAPPPRP